MSREVTAPLGSFPEPLLEPLGGVGEIPDTSLAFISRSRDVLGRSLDVLSRSLDVLRRPLNVLRRPLAFLGRSLGFLERSLDSMSRSLDAIAVGTSINEANDLIKRAPTCFE